MAMKVSNLSRRGFLRRFGVGVGGAGLIAAACGDNYNERAAKYQEMQQKGTTGGSSAATTSSSSSASAAASHNGTTTPSTNAQSGGTHSGSSAADIDAMHEKGVKLFPAKTKGQSEPLAFKMEGDTKVFNISMVKTRWEVKPDEFVDTYAYNGVLPGPEIRVTEGDKVRVVVKNELPESSTIHWHGLKIPNKMDGVPFITQPPIKPGETFTYEFVAQPVGPHMYHSHHNAMEQVGRGLLGAFIVEPKDKSTWPRFDKEHVMVLNDTLLGFTLNGKSFPATTPLVAKMGETYLVRFMNEGLMNHPMHLHGLPFTVIARDGWLLSNPFQCDTLDVAPGERWDVLIKCTEEGVWAFHCHTLSHAESPQGMFGLVTALVIQA